MKVLHVISGDLWAGAEVQACTLLTALNNQPGMEVAAAVMNEGELARRLREQRIAVTVFPEDRLNGLQILIGLRQLMTAWKPDIVHTHRTKENILGSIANALTRNVPCVRTAHGASEHAANSLPKKTLRWLDLWCGNRLQRRIVAVSDELAGKLAVEFPREKIVVIENGVDLEAIRSQTKPVEFRVREPEALHIGIVGRLAPVKRVDLFLEMAAILRRRHPEYPWRFHVFGDGPLLETLQTQAHRLDVAQATTFHGHRSDSIACIAALDGLVMCSDHEGLPMTLLECLAVGTPVIAHAIASLTKILEKRPDAALVTDHEAGAYASALFELLQNIGKSPRALLDAGIPTASDNSGRMQSLYATLHNQH